MSRPQIQRVTIVCQTCGQEFEQRITSKRQFCSRRCSGIATAKRYSESRTRQPCLFCGKEYESIKSRDGKTRFCSRMCQNTFLARAYAHAHGDALRGSGEGKTYIKQNGRHQHRIIAEQIIGRPLEKGETVHHKNGNRRDNRPENIEVLPSQAEHARIHSTKGRKCTVPGCGRKHAAKGFCEKHWRQNKKRMMLQQIAAGVMSE